MKKTLTAIHLHLLCMFLCSSHCIFVYMLTICHLLGDADRYARVTVIRGSHKDCMDYKVRKLQRGVREASTPVHTCVHACVVCHRDNMLEAGLGAACGEAK